MVATKVGIREFRAGLADYIEAGAPVTVTRHGRTVGYFIPAKSDRAPVVAEPEAAGEEFDARRRVEEPAVDELVEELRQLRRGSM